MRVSAERKIFAGLSRFGADLLSVQIDRNSSQSQWHVVLADQKSSKLISALGQRVSRLKAQMFTYKEYAWIQCRVRAGQNFFSFFSDETFLSNAVHIEMTQKTLDLLIPRDQSGLFVKNLFCYGWSPLENKQGQRHA